MTPRLHAELAAFDWAFESLGDGYYRIDSRPFPGFVVVLDDVSIAGHSDEGLLPLVVFSLNRSAVRDVMVNGCWVVRDGRHPLQDEIVSRYKELHWKIWGNR